MLCVYFKALKFPPKTHSSDNCVVSSAPERHRDESLLSRVWLVVVVVSVFTHFHNSPSAPSLHELRISGAQLMSIYVAQSTI